MKHAILILLLATAGCANYTSTYVRYDSTGNVAAKVTSRYNQFLFFSKASAVESHTEVGSEYSRTLLTKDISTRSDTEAIKEIRELTGHILESISKGAVSGVIPVP